MGNTNDTEYWNNRILDGYEEYCLQEFNEPIKCGHFKNAFLKRYPSSVIIFSDREVCIYYSNIDFQNIVEKQIKKKQVMKLID